MPRGWQVVKLRHVVDMRVSNVDKLSIRGELPVRLCNYVDVYKHDRITQRIPFMAATATRDEINRFKLELNDVLITKDSEDWLDIGVPALVDFVSDDLVCGYHLALLRARRSFISGKFLFQCFQSRFIANQLSVEARGVTRYGLSRSAILNTLLPLPPPSEQVAIVKYLDYMTRRIDKAIRVKKKLIQLLNEQKQVIIHQAVTRGLNPDVPLKDSGVPWLGMVPEHWEVRKVQSLGSKFGSGITPKGGANVYLQIGVPLIRSQNVHFDGLRLDNVARISKDIHDSMLGSKLLPGDVLLNITGASIGRVCYFPDSIGEANVNQHVCIIRCKQKYIIPAYLSAIMSTEVVQAQIRVLQYGASREGLTMSSVKKILIPLPSLYEQEAILSLIQEETSAIRKIMAGISHGITLLQEYRTRLIADVVTGQIDVRDMAAQLPDEQEDVEPFDLEDVEEVLMESEQDD